MPRRALLLIGLCLGAAVAYGQPRPEAQRLETGFERAVNRYRWTADLALAQPLGAWRLAAASRFFSDAFILFENDLSFREEAHFSAEATRPLGPRTAVVLDGEAAWFSLSRVFHQRLFAGLRFRPRPSLWIEPRLGMAVDQRPGAVLDVGPGPLRTDVGPALGLRLALAPPPVNGYRFGLEGDGTWARIAPRQGQTGRLVGRAERRFEDTHFTSEVRLATVRRDVYQAVSFLNRNTGGGSETVESTTSDTLLAVLTLDAPLFRGLRFTSRLDLGANNRFVRTLDAPDDALFFDSDFNRRSVDVEAGLGYAVPRLDLHLAVRGGAEVERRRLTNADALPAPQAAQKQDLLRQADYDRGLFSLLGRARFDLSRRLTLRADGSASILRHDTPALNPDDRDELFSQGSLGLRLRLSRYLDADLQLFATHFHTVYLKSSRSAENNVQRSLRLRPTIRWTPAPRTRLRLSSEVRATYTVDDFLLPGRRPTDQSAREVRYDAEATHDFGGGLLLRATGSLSDLRLGRFLDDAFAEIPFDTLRTYSGWLRLQAGQRITAEIGLRVFIRSDFDRALTVRYPTEGGTTASLTRPGRERIEQIGPTCALVWPMRGGSALRFDGWATVQHVRRRLFGTLPEDDVDTIRRAAHRGTRTFIPNLSVTALWTF